MYIVYIYIYCIYIYVYIYIYIQHIFDVFEHPNSGYFRLQSGHRATSPGAFHADVWHVQGEAILSEATCEPGALGLKGL